jgi:hypothetical protein
LVTGFAAGYYAGAKAGRQRYDQINRALRKARRSEAFEAATDKAKTALDEGVDKARDLVESRTGNGSGADAPPTATNPPPYP